MEGISISLDEVRQIASTISQLNKSLETKLLDIQNDMKSLQNSWQSAAATTIQERFNAYAQKYYNTYKEVIDSYVNFLNKTVADNYEGTENNINNNASKFI